MYHYIILSQCKKKGVRLRCFFLFFCLINNNRLSRVINENFPEERLISIRFNSEMLVFAFNFQKTLVKNDLIEIGILEMNEAQIVVNKLFCTIRMFSCVLFALDVNIFNTICLEKIIKRIRNKFS